MYEGGQGTVHGLMEGHSAQGKVYDYPVTSLDIYATAAANANAKAPENIEGDLVPYLNGAKIRPTASNPILASRWQVWFATAI